MGWIIGIGIVVVGGVVVAIIVANAGEDAQEGAANATARGTSAVFNEDCGYSGRPIAFINGLTRGSAASPSGALGADVFDEAADLNNTGFIGNLRLTDDLSESLHNADFNGDGDIDNVIAANKTVGFFGTAAKTIGDDDDVVVVPEDGWDNLRITLSADMSAFDNRLQLFVNGADTCWGIRRI